MIETRRAGSVIHALGLMPSPLARHLHEGQEVLDMHTEPTVDRTTATQPTLPAAAVVPLRSTRRATARRASDRRATAREHKDDIDGRIFGYVKHHRQSTTGDMAKGLNADRGTIALEVSHMLRAGELTREPESGALTAPE
jgi:hypothetical protein